METSDTTLEAANKQYKDQRGTIKQSHGLLRTMRVNSIKDSLKLYAALTFFTLVLAYVGFRRMSYFVPPGLVPSMPSLAAFGIGSQASNSTAGLPDLEFNPFRDSETHGHGADQPSAAGASFWESSFAQLRRQGGVIIGQAAHHSRHFAVWAFQQAHRLIGTIKQKIEERQGRKLGEGTAGENNPGIRNLLYLGSLSNKCFHVPGGACIQVGSD